MTVNEELSRCPFQQLQVRYRIHTDYNRNPAHVVRITFVPRWQLLGSVQERSHSAFNFYSATLTSSLQYCLLFFCHLSMQMTAREVLITNLWYFFLTLSSRSASLLPYSPPLCDCFSAASDDTFGHFIPFCLLFLAFDGHHILHDALKKYSNALFID